MIEPQGLEHLEAATANMNSGGVILFTAHIQRLGTDEFRPFAFRRSAQLSRTPHGQCGGQET